MVLQLAVGPAYSTFVPQLSYAAVKDGRAGGDQPCFQAASLYKAVWTEPLQGFQQGEINLEDSRSVLSVCQCLGCSLRKSARYRKDRCQTLHKHAVLYLSI